MTQTAEIICDSIGEFHQRLTTFRVRQMRFIHSEFLRHRMLSFSAGSSRAIPVAKLIAEVRDDATRAAPVWWGSEQKGMQSGAELKNGEGLWEARITWRNAALDAVERAESMVQLSVHKSLVNRILEPFSHINVVVTGCESSWFNFFGLRLDKAAQPEMRALAELMWAEWNESTPKKLTLGQWHLPFITMKDHGYPNDTANVDDQMLIVQRPGGMDRLIRVSVARCARTSFTSYETGKRSTVEEDLKLYERLVGSRPLHASPAEHQATPDERYPTAVVAGSHFKNPKQHGNLPGWRQYRKMLPEEAVAALPEGYIYRPPVF